MSDRTALPGSVFPPATTESLRERYDEAVSFDVFLPTAEENADLWAAIWKRAEAPEALVERVKALPGTWHLLVLNEDWCGDAVNTLPPLARLAAETSNLDLRLLARDEHLDLMDAHLTNGRARSIPVVLFLDEDFEERGWWGPRPSELQAWVMEEGLKMESEERYKHVRRWYARDKGRTALEEVVAGLEAVADDR